MTCLQDVTERRIITTELIERRSKYVRTHHPDIINTLASPRIPDLQNHQRYDWAVRQNEQWTALSLAIQTGRAGHDCDLYRNREDAEGGAPSSQLQNHRGWTQAFPRFDDGHYLQSRRIPEDVFAKGASHGVSEAFRTSLPDRSLYELLPGPRFAP